MSTQAGQNANGFFNPLLRSLRGKRGLVLGTVTIVLLGLIFFAGRYPNALNPVRNLVFDTYQQIKPRQNDDSAVVVIDVDEASIEKLGQWPWPRTVMAMLTDRLTQAGALAIGFDIVFSEPDRTSPSMLLKSLPQSLRDDTQLAERLNRLENHDAQFARSIARAPSVLAFFDSANGDRDGASRSAGVSWLGEDLTTVLQPMSGSLQSLDIYKQQAAGHGHISLGRSQTDDVVRTVPLFMQLNGKAYPSLSIEALRIALQSATGEQQSFLISTTFAGREGGDIEGSSGGLVAITQARLGNFIIPLTARGELNLYYARNAKTDYLSVAQALEAEPQTLADQVGGKIALIGTSASGLRDIRTTVLREPVPGVAVHAQIIDQIMQGAFLNRPDWAPGAEIALSALLSIAIILLLPLTGAVMAAIVGATAIAIIFGTSWFAFSRHGILFDPLVPALSAVIAFMLTTLLLYAFAERQRRFVRQAFQHYLAPSVLTRLEADPDALKLGGEIRNMTLMFMDVRNFTPISETLSPEQLVTFLNQLLSPLTEIIQRHEGAIDKYIGDSIMAFWNAPLDVEDHPRKACIAALEMIEKVDELNARDAFGFKALGLPPVGIGIGINTGEGCVGNMGSSTRFDYSVVGDTVNVAARLEGASKDAGWPVLISRTVADQAADMAILEAGMITLKGKSEPLPVFGLIGDASHARSSEFVGLRQSLSDLVKSRGKNRKLALQHCLSQAKPQLHDFIRNRI